MNEGKIFLVGAKGEKLLPMVEQPYPKEDILQSFLERYPDLMPGDQIDVDEPRRWLLVTREMGVPGADGAADRWSLDHLFLDQDGIPTFVECKRAADTRARREVVAQMLDYAANGTQYWSMDRLRQAATETARASGKAIDDEIAALTEGTLESAVEPFWKKVEDNLYSGRVRLVFVADVIPTELRRLVEFLNEKMADVEVLAVEVKQFIGEGRTALVPRVIGVTEAARTAKGEGGGSRSQTTRDTFLASCPPGTAPLFQQALELAEARGHVIYWGVKGFSIRVRRGSDGALVSVAYGYPHGSFEFYLQWLSEEGGAAIRRELLATGRFREGGEHTLRTQVAPGSINELMGVIEATLERIEEDLGGEPAPVSAPRVTGL